MTSEVVERPAQKVPTTTSKHCSAEVKLLLLLGRQEIQRQKHESRVTQHLLEGVPISLTSIFFFAQGGKFKVCTKNVFYFLESSQIYFITLYHIEHHFLL